MGWYWICRLAGFSEILKNETNCSNNYNLSITNSQLYPPKNTPLAPRNTNRNQHIDILSH